MTNYSAGEVRAKILLPADATASFTVTFSVNGKTATKTLNRGNETFTFNVTTDPELNEYE